MKDNLYKIKRVPTKEILNKLRSFQRTNKVNEKIIQHKLRLAQKRLENAHI